MFLFFPFCLEFHIIICGLDSIIARRWMNSMLVSNCMYTYYNKLSITYRCLIFCHKFRACNFRVTLVKPFPVIWHEDVINNHRFASTTSETWVNLSFHPYCLLPSLGKRIQTFRVAVDCWLTFSTTWKRHWTTSASSPIFFFFFFQKSWDFYTITRVYLWYEYMFIFTCNFNSVTKI